MKRAPKKARRAAKADLPAFVTPQLATPVTAPPKGGDWVYEVKHDGYRMLSRFSSDGIRLFTRSGNDWTGKLGLDDAWLDGEIVVPGPDGRANFQALQNAFDAPFLDGKDLRLLALKVRKKTLKAKLSGHPSSHHCCNVGGTRDERIIRGQSPNSSCPYVQTEFGL